MKDLMINKKYILVITGLIFSFGLIIFLFISSRQADSPREMFLSGFIKKSDLLVKVLKEYGPEKKMGKFSVYSDGKRRDTSVPMDTTMQAHEIVRAAEQVVEHFKGIPMTFLIEEDLDKIDAWGQQLKNQMDQLKKLIKQEISRIKQDFIEDRSLYNSSIFGPALDLTEQGKLYFVVGNTGYFIDDMLEIDLDKWLIEIKKQMNAINNKTNSSKVSPVISPTDDAKNLALAIQSSDSNQVRKLLAAGADVNVVNKYGWTPLMIASQYGNTSIIKILLEAGADINVRTPMGVTPLSIATQNGQIHVARLLREHLDKD